MKHSFFTSLIVLIVFGCSEQEAPTESSNVTSTEESTTAPLTSEEVITPENTSIQEINTVEKDYQEFHENGQLKIEGDFDENNARNGLWVSYYENGSKWSESFYTNGVKNGHSITFFPNGKVRYVGEYINDEKSGRWSFYDEEGNLVQEENY